MSGQPAAADPQIPHLASQQISVASHETGPQGTSAAGVSHTSKFDGNPYCAPTSKRQTRPLWHSASESQSPCPTVHGQLAEQNVADPRGLVWQLPPPEHCCW